MRRQQPLFGFLCVAVSVAVWGAGQQLQHCEWVVTTTPGSPSHFELLPEGGSRLDASGGVEASCGPDWVRADSAIYFDRRGELYLYGNVRYRGSLRTLEADRATYYTDDDKVLAQGNVVLTDLAGGSSLEGPVLHYFPQTETRPVERIYAPDRPHLRFYAEASEQPDSSAFDVDADHIHIYGDSVVAAAGRVVAVRTDLNAFGDSMHLDLSGNRLWLLGDPRVEASNLLLEGDTITAVLDGEEIREIFAWPNGSAQGREMSLTAPNLHFFVDEGDITRTIASPGASPASRGDLENTVDEAAAVQEPWARAESEEYVLTADSIDIARPGGVLQEVRAFRGARATSAQPVIPEDSLFGRDWMEGDSIIAYFEASDSANAAADGSNGSSPTTTDGSGSVNLTGVTEEDGSQVELRRLVASGNARALYHLRQEQPDSEGDGEPALNYVIGRIVTIWLQGGEVQETQVVGPSTGLYLEPLPGGAAADSTNAPPDSASVDAQPPPEPDATPVPPSGDGRNDAPNSRGAS